MTSLLNDFQYIWGTALQEMIVNEYRREHKVLGNVFARENLSCISNIDGPYYSSRYIRKYVFTVASPPSFVRYSVILPAM